MVGDNIFYFNKGFIHVIQGARDNLGKPSFKKIKEIMENSIIGCGGQSLFEAIK